MNEKHNNGRGIFYGVIGVATLIVAIIGATFAYFTASQNNNTTIAGNAASVTFGLQVERISNPAETKGLIPMSNSMVQQAVTGGNSGAKGFCVDDADNLVCQIYKVTVNNTSNSSMFLDGYVTLHDKITPKQTPADVPSAPTIMRWAQVFATTSDQTTTYSTAGTTELGTDSGKEPVMTAIGANTSSDNTGNNLANVYYTGGTLTDAMLLSPTEGTQDNPVVTFNSGNVLQVIKRNYIRISNNSSNTGYNRTMLTDALVYNIYLPGKTQKDLYFVVWMSENAQNQTLNGEAATGFFDGNVTFLSAAGGEVSATFSGFSRVTQPGTAPAPAEQSNG